MPDGNQHLRDLIKQTYGLTKDEDVDSFAKEILSRQKSGAPAPALHKSKVELAVGEAHDVPPSSIGQGGVHYAQDQREKQGRAIAAKPMPSRTLSEAETLAQYLRPYNGVDPRPQKDYLRDMGHFKAGVSGAGSNVADLLARSRDRAAPYFAPHPDPWNGPQKK